MDVVIEYNIGKEELCPGDVVSVLTGFGTWKNYLAVESEGVKFSLQSLGGSYYQHTPMTSHDWMIFLNRNYKENKIYSSKEYDIHIKKK